MPGNEALNDDRRQDELKVVIALITRNIQRVSNVLADELSRAQEQNDWLLNAAQKLNELQHRLELEENARREAAAPNASLQEEVSYLRRRLQRAQEVELQRVRRQPETGRAAIGSHTDFESGMGRSPFSGGVMRPSFSRFSRYRWI